MTTSISSSATQTIISAGTNPNALVLDATGIAQVGSINGGQIGGRRNYFLNGSLAVFQRGNVTTAAGGSAYTADMIHVTASAGLTCQVAQGDYGATLGPRGARYNANIVFSGTGAAGSTVRLLIEDVTRFSAGSFTFSADMSSSVNQTITIICRQHFGVGGSVSVDTSTSQALNASNETIIKTFALPSTAGKTLGVGHHLEVIFVTGVANAHTLYLMNAQFELGTVATTPERMHPGDDLAACRRCYETGKGLAGVLSSNLTRAFLAAGNDFKVAKRAVPAMAYTSTIVPTANSISAYDSSGQVVISVPPGVSVDGLREFVQTSTAMQTGIYYAYTWTAAADLVP